MVDFSAMTNGLTNRSEFWASLRTRKRGDGGLSHAVLYRVDGGQRTLTFRDNAAAAEAFAAAIKAHGIHRALAMHGYEIRRDQPSGVTVGKYIAQHIDALSGLERKTLAEYRRYLTRDFEPTLGYIPLTALTRADISKWVNKLHETGATGGTIKNKLGFLSGVLNAAVRDGDLPANPAAGIRVARTIRREMEILTRAEFDILKAAFTERWHPLLDLLVSSGCRFSEATALTPADVDRAKGTIRITKAWKRVPDGDGDRYELGQPKTRRSTRTISIPGSVLDDLDLSGEYVFRNSQGGPIRLYSFRSNVWTKSLAKAKAVDPDDPDKPVLTKPVRIHDLRHTAASWLLGAGVPLIVVSAHLGHEDTSVTSRVYGHMLPGAGQAAADAMGKILAQ
jgi:integrase